MRRTAGNRDKHRTTMSLSLFVEELLEELFERGVIDTNSEAGRLGIELFARQELGDARVDEIAREIGEESA